MPRVLQLGVVIVVLLGGRCLGAEPQQASTAPAAIVIKDGDTLEVGERRFVVNVVGGQRNKVWEMEGSEDGTLAFWHEGKITVCDPKRGVLKELECPWRLNTLSASRKRAVVDIVTPGHDVQVAIADLTTQKLLMTLREKNFGRRWVFGPGGRYVVPLEGSGDFVVGDMETGKSVQVALPKMALAGDEWEWSGFVMADGKNACIFMHSAGGMSLKTYRAVVPLDDPAGAKIEESADGLAGFVKHLEKDDVLVRECFHSGEPQMLAVVSEKSWQVQRRVEERSAVGEMLAGTISPDGKWSYFCDRFKGLSIYDRATEKLAGHGPDRDGWSFNALSLGVTFDDTGALAIVGSPYDGLLMVLRTKDHGVVGRYVFKDGVAPAGAIVMPPEKAGGPSVLLVVSTFLLYE